MEEETSYGSKRVFHIKLRVNDDEMVINKERSDK